MEDGKGVDLKKLEERFSREIVIDCPHFMALLGYLGRTHELPRHGWMNNKILYHYTDAQGLLGIIQSGRLWATDMRFLNDPSEGNYFPERLLGFMASTPEGETEVGRIIISGIKNALLNPRSENSVFCVSLSENGDLLSQWRGYGGFGRGYAIGLELGYELPHPQVAQYYEVTYGDAVLESLAADLLDIFLSSYDRYKDRMFDDWAYTLSVVSRSFKDYCYSEEKESRLVCFRSSEGDSVVRNECPLKFRARGGDIIPYIPMSLGLLEEGVESRLPIRRIIVGPGVDFKRNHVSIKELLKEFSYDDVDVIPSAIPFRPE